MPQELNYLCFKKRELTKAIIKELKRNPEHPSLPRAKEMLAKTDSEILGWLSVWEPDSDYFN
jgi:hypothetical protein